MKQLTLTVIAFLGIVTASWAQQKVNDKAEIKTPEAQCDKCKEKIENYLAHQYGITSVNVNIKKKTTTVTWITDRTNIEEIKTAIANAGFDADDVTAEETTYKRLPPCCKKSGEKPSAAEPEKKP